MIRISFENCPGSELAFREAETEEQAAQMAIELIRDMGSLSHGDRIIITEPEA